MTYLNFSITIRGNKKISVFFDSDDNHVDLFDKFKGKLEEIIISQQFDLPNPKHPSDASDLREAKSGV